MLDYTDINQIITKELKKKKLLETHEINYDAKITYNKNEKARRIKFYYKKTLATLHILYQPLTVLPREIVISRVNQHIDNFVSGILKHENQLTKS